MSAGACSFCHNPLERYGCAAGRCCGPRARTEETPAATVAPPPRSTTPLGAQRVVLANDYRAGPKGGEMLVLWLDCDHVVWRGAGRRRGAPSKTVLCISCAPVELTCAGGCGSTTPVDAAVRGRRWVFFGGAWWCRACARRALLGETGGR